MIPAGTILDRYEILSPLGAGGMGEVYRAHDRQLGRDVAIKILPPEMASDRDRVLRFEREARAVAALSHPNVLAIHDFGTASGISYAVTELLKGETLRARLQRSRPPWPEAVRIAAAICDGIAAAHSKGIIHRDLKPENIFLTADGQVKVLDFGLAQSTNMPSESTSTLVRTEAGRVMGTPGYMSPEQLRGESIGPATDIFALGCVLYEMLTGHRVAEGSAPLREVPEDLDRIVRHCLRANPQERFQSAYDLAFALRSIGQSKRYKSVAIAAAIFAILAAGLFWVQRSRHATIDSVAVLPFVNVSHDPETDYLSDGVTEALINELSEIGTLRVIPRASVFRFKGSDFHEAASRLRVRSVVTGRVLRRGNALNVQAELIDVSNDRQLWGRQYQNQMADLVNIQSDIARDIADHLRLGISPEERRRVSNPATANPVAFDAYLKGRYFWNKRTAENIRKSIDYFNQAIEADPTYALAYSGVSDAYGLLGFHGYGGMRPNEAMPQAKAAALKATQIDPTLAEAHTSLANVFENYDWNLTAAELEYRRAIALNPNYPTAHQWLAFDLVQQQKFEQSIAEMRRANALDPLSLIINVNLSWMYYFARRFPEAERQAVQTREIDPRFYPIDWTLSETYAQSGRYADSIAASERAVKITNGNLLQRAALAHRYAVAGKIVEAKGLLNELLRISRERYIPPYFFALIYAGLRENDSAFAWLEKSFQERSAAMMFLRIEPMLDPLRSDPRFDELVRRVDAARR